MKPSIVPLLRTSSVLISFSKDSFEILRKFTSVEFKKDDKKTKDHYELLKSLLPPI
jgi:hypothetical protein